jgi:hypothetical protein
MKTIKIIVHCYAEKHPEFARMLTAQLSSLLYWQPTDRVFVTVCTSQTDILTHQVVADFGKRFECERSPVRVCAWMFAKEELFKRAIGRNAVAKVSTADVIWFADADYLFGEKCLDTLAETRIEGLVFPRKVMIHRSHELGDQELKRIVPGEIFQADLSLFEEHRVRYAIGGLQIVPGSLGRKGYLDGTRWTKPLADASVGFQDTREDRIYRGEAGPSQPIDLPSLYRMRHSASAFESAESRLAQTSHKH